MSVTPSPIGGFAAQFFDNNGVILSGGKIYTYAAGTTTPQASYTSAAGVTAHANPIILDSAGRVPGGEIWLTDGLIYKFVIETALSVLIGTYDNITGVNSNFVNYTVQEEVITATAGQTVFNLSTINYTPGTNSLSVYIDGVNQYVGDSYLETDSDTVTFTAGVHVGGEVKFTTAVQTTTAAIPATAVAFTGFKAQIGSVQDLADDDGSDWIGFIQSGTGAVAETAQSALRRLVISPETRGAVVNGLTNDQTAIANQLADTRGTTFSPGVYLFNTGNLSPAAKTVVRGSGRENTFLRCGHASNPAFSSTSNFVTYEDFTTDRSGSIAGKGIVGSGVSNASPLEGWSLNRVNVNGHSTGVELTDFVLAFIENTYIQNGATGLKTATTGANANTMLSVRHSWIRQHTTHCVDLASLVDGRFDTVAFEGSGIVGPSGVNASACKSLNFTSCWWEKLVQAGTFTAVPSILFEGGYVDGTEVPSAGQAFLFTNCGQVVFGGGMAVDNLNPSSRWFATADVGTTIWVRDPALAGLAWRAVNGGRVIFDYWNSAQSTWNPANVGAVTLGTGTTVTATGVRLGDICQASFENATSDPQNFMFKADCFADDTITVRPFNMSAGAIDLASGTLSVSWRKRALIS